MKRILVTAVAFCLFLGSAASAGDLTHPTGKVILTVPETWQEQADADNLLISPKDGAPVAMVFSMLEATELDAAIDASLKIVVEKVGALRDTPENQGNFDQNGMPGWYLESYSADGKVNVEIAIVITPTGKALLIYYFGAADLGRKYIDDYNAIYKSLRPVAAAAPAPAPAPTRATAGGDLTHPTGKVILTVPETWQGQADADNLLISPKDGAPVAMVFSMLEATELDAAIDASLKIVVAKVGALRDTPENQGNFDQNGMPGWYLETYSADGKVNVEIAIVITPTGKALLIYYFGSADLGRKYIDDYNAIYKSLRPAA